ncbi:MAG: bifunctional helix-turn-helix domain-containing protein/methylated-DNA--[protein]-cysteine S-methyltransferase [bacterium]
MNSENYLQASIDYQRIERAIIFLEKNFHKQPSLKRIAESVYLSEYHFQRLFSRWVGISPKRFIQFLTKEYAKSLLEKSKNLSDAAYETGLSSPSRLHDLFVTCEAVTPGEFKTKGEGLIIVYGFHACPFGECLLALTDRGICGLSFVQNGNRPQALAKFKAHWKNAKLYEDPNLTRPLISQIFNPSITQKPGPLHIFLNGTNFQIKVWEALLRIPIGYVVSYEDVALHIGRPGASRAVGSAIARNPVSYIIPCHRVIRKIGKFGNYQGGTARKKAILGWEAAQVKQR